MAKLVSLTKERLIQLYAIEKKSLEEIGHLFNASRVAVYKKLIKFGIKQRSKSEARLQAQKQGKLPQEFFDIKDNFFSNWSSEMAYVLGLIITDGCISKAGTISLCMNDKELLEKVKAAMRSQHKITPSKYQKGLYLFNFARENMVKDLYNFGIKPKKSLIVKFPEIPEVFMSDFIRGVFDGDGSVFLQKDSKDCCIRTKFCSGSKEFISKLEICLQKLGLPKRNIYEQKTKNGIYHEFKYGHRDSRRLFNILYKNYPNIIFLERKYNKFIEGFRRSEVNGERTSRMA